MNRGGRIIIMLRENGGGRQTEIYNQREKKSNRLAERQKIVRVRPRKKREKGRRKDRKSVGRREAEGSEKRENDIGKFRQIRT